MERKVAVATQRKSGQTRSNGDVTRAKILDAAEVLFGDNGFDAVSLRDITDAAGVTLALASYHFGAKENLFEAVVERRAGGLCRSRMERLAALAAPDARAILDAFMAPLFEQAKSGEAGWRAYMKVLARLGEDVRWLDLLGRHFDATAQAFIAALRLALPGAKPQDVTRAFTMMLQVMLATASQHARVDKLSGGKIKASDFSAAYPALLRFVTAGLESCARQ